MVAAKLDQFLEMDWFASRVRDRRYLLSEHVVRALMGGQVTTREIESALQNGRLLEEHQHAKRGTSYLVAGRNGKDFIHLVCAEGNGLLVLLFAYRPTLPAWENALRRSPPLKDDTGETCATCYFCGGALKQVTVGNFDYRVEGQLYVIKRVPASLCLECGEKYIDAEVGHRLNALITAQQFTASEQIGVIDYR